MESMWCGCRPVYSPKFPTISANPQKTNCWKETTALYRIRSYRNAQETRRGERVWRTITCLLSKRVVVVDVSSTILTCSAMDLFDQVGRYGTVSLLKRNDPQSAVTSFGVDREELTFGRESSCGVRLYYPDVAVVHCKLVINDQKVCLPGLTKI